MNRQPCHMSDGEGWGCVLSHGHRGACRDHTGRPLSMVGPEEERAEADRLGKYVCDLRARQREIDDEIHKLQLERTLIEEKVLSVEVWEKRQALEKRLAEARGDGGEEAPGG